MRLASSFFFVEIYYCIGAILLGSVMLQAIGFQVFRHLQKRNEALGISVMIGLTAGPWLFQWLLQILPFETDPELWPGTAFANAVLSIIVIAILSKKSESH